MEHLRYTAEDEVKTSPKYPFFSFGLWFGFILAAISGMILVYPGQALETAILTQPDSTDVDFRYSLILLRKTSSFNLTWSQIMENPAKAVQMLDANRTSSEFQGNNLWLNYIVLRGIVFSRNIDPQDKQNAKGVMLAYLNTFRNMSLLESQNKQLASDALSINQAPVALVFYEKILAQNPNQAIELYSKIAKTALWAKQCEKAANYYFQQQNRFSDIEDKRYFYFAALEALIQCDKEGLAMDLAIKNLDGLSEDIQTYQKLIDFAISADRPEKARDFMFKMMELKARESVKK